ncbi:MAG: hypothetical protein GY754_32660 [bacterium]|nr:hypothetical protein [bacterium]
MENKQLLKLIERTAKEKTTELDLSNNQLSSLPPEIGKLTSLTQLDLRKNPLPIPLEILNKTNEPATIIPTTTLSR